VWIAKERNSGKIVAAKVLSAQSSDDPTVTATLLNEFRTASQIRHPNVVSVLYGSSTDNVGPYILMEYLPDGNLAEFLKAQSEANTQLSIQRALEMMIEVAQGVKAINERLIHRDIKPDNVLRQGDRLKIADFGLSKFVDQRTRTNTFKGIQHLHYMAPEVWESQTHSTKIDVYSVGLLFFEILTLRHPFLNSVTDPANPNHWRKAHLFTRPPDVRAQRTEVPLGVSQVLARMVAKRPQDRPEWDEILNHLRGSGASVERSTNVERLVELAVDRHSTVEKHDLQQRQQQEQARERLNIYNHSCEELLSNFDEIVRKFNERFQLGKISVQDFRHDWAFSHPGRVYHIPNAGSITCQFFTPTEGGVRIQNQELIGGGIIELHFGPSANLLLLKQSSDDLYGHWAVCLVEISAIADARKLIGKYGLTQETVTPFGFHEQTDFYDQIRYASGVMHVFNYQIRNDPGAFFVELLEGGLKG
jgi:eukaryotic-like serine/threonine-protein kinase